METINSAMNSIDHYCKNLSHKKSNTQTYHKRLQQLSSAQNDRFTTIEDDECKSTSDTAKPVRILVAEDNDSNYLLVKSILKHYGITRAVNGEEAVKLMKDREFDIVFMDIRMPVMDGLEATVEIRKFNKEIKIIALTANVFDSDKERALDAGCDEFITKPVSRSTLTNIVETIDREKKSKE